MQSLIDLPAIDYLAKQLARQRWLPVRVRHFPYNALDSFRQRRIARTAVNGQGRIRFVAFTCRQHFHLLECALESLLLLATSDIRDILLFVDDQDFFDDDQAGRLRGLSPLIVITRWPRFTGWGFDSVRLQFRTFSEVAASMADGDYIAKIDSDLIFISRWIFPLAVVSGADIVGDGRYLDFEYAQGGCFLLGKALAARLATYCEPGVLETMFPVNARPAEEPVLREVLRREKSRVWFTRFMMFPDEFEPILKKGRASVTTQEGRFCVLHFLRDKDAMPGIYRQSIRPALQASTDG